MFWKDDRDDELQRAAMSLLRVCYCYCGAVQIGLLSAAPPLLMTVVVIAGGFLFDKLIKGQFIGRTLGRKVAQTLGKQFRNNDTPLKIKTFFY